MKNEKCSTKSRKRDRVKISNIDEFKEILIKEGYDIDKYNGDKFNDDIQRIFNIDSYIIEKLNSYLENGETIYKVDNAEDFIDYVQEIIYFEKYQEMLHKKIKDINYLTIERVEYEREICIQDEVEHIKAEIEKIKESISGKISVEEKENLDMMEQQIDKNYVYSKDIEFLKKMISVKNQCVREVYDEELQVKTLCIEVPEGINYEYIKHERGTVEYHQFLTSSIPRMKRLIRNLHKYMVADISRGNSFRINQSSAVQDSVNIAAASYDNKEFKAISGKNDIEGYISAPMPEKCRFESCKVNKRGNLGIGYKRVNDSEKKILEEIDRQIEEKILKDKGTLTLYSKWEPCPSCYYVISQFCHKHPDIKFNVRYDKKYGE